LINNDSDSWLELQNACTALGHDITPIHFSEIPSIDPHSYETAVLSGGFWYDDEVQLLNTYAQELLFIKSAPIPILGICLGMQLMHVAMEKAVPLLDEPQSGYRYIEVNVQGQELLGLPDSTRAVLEAAEEFEALAASPHHIEAMAHRFKPLLGVQFHPEVTDTAQDYEILDALLATVGKLRHDPVPA
jgi:GMP synthase (glutamine-hydrolysing)